MNVPKIPIFWIFFLVTSVEYKFDFGALGPILCEIENADRKRKTAFFDLEFFDQKNKAILCARILAISEQHFSI